MNERRQDFELLQRFTRQGEQSAFADLVRRHLDLVYATALRKVEDLAAAQEVAQDVFTVLARKAWRFAPDDSLPAWLHKTALLESKFWLRGDLRRRRREKAAAELGTTMRTPEDQPAFQTLVPLLDEALVSLRERDRTALLLRYYESQSLREVGAAFGVSEDAAQKRVQTALERLGEFFKRRGFKTATVAAAAAALQHTSASASATLVSTVVGAALSAAPPALTGLGALLARLTSLSRGQTAALCVVLAAVPVGWQLHQRDAAAEAAKRMQRQLLAAQNEGATVESELERLRATSGRLDRAVAQANEAAARAAESARAFEAWKRKTRSQLAAADYRWDDDSAFVRIPKSILPELTQLTKFIRFTPPGVVGSYARELMGTTPREREAVEEILQRHVPDLDRARQSVVYETNELSDVADVTNRVFVWGKLGEEAKPVAEQTLAELDALLGEERLSAMDLSATNLAWLEDIMVGEEKITIRLEPNAEGALTADFTCSFNTSLSSERPGQGYSRNMVGIVHWPLSEFLPDGDPMATNASAKMAKRGLAEALSQRAATWLQNEAKARLGKEAKP